MLPSDISVVICAYTLDRWSDIQRAAASALVQEPSVREILLIVDHNDGLLRLAEEHWESEPLLRVLPSSAVLRGLSGARDTGVADSSGQVVAFLDDDAAAEPGWAAALAAAYGSGHVLGVGGGIDPVWPRRRPTWWPPEYDWVVGCSYKGQPEVTSSVRNVIGANMSFRKEVLDSIGGFDARIGRVGADFAGGEETELCIRARSVFPDGHVVLEPAARVRHRVSADRATWGYFMRRCYGEGLTKGRVGKLAGHDSATSTERGYVLRTLPVGALRGLLSRDPRRGIAVVVGLLCAAVAYLRERRNP